MIRALSQLLSPATAVEDTSQEQPSSRKELSVESIGSRWRELDLCPGDIVLIAMPNSAELLGQFFGVLAAGGVPALVSPATSSVRMHDLIRAFGARAVVAPRLWPAKFGVEQAWAVGDAQAVVFESRPAHSTTPGEVIILTSGTSGFASGCLFALESLMLNATRHADAIGLRAGDTVLVNLPLHFSYALVAQIFAALIRGARIVISGPPFHGPSYLALLAKHEVTVSSLTPFLARTLVQQGHRIPERLRVLTVGGDRLEPRYVEQLLRLCPNRELYLTYGLTEAGPRVSTLAAHREPTQRFDSVGLPLPQTRVLFENTRATTGPRELLVSSETLMKRRIGLVEGRTGQDWYAPGILATGDVFDRDEDGYLYFQGRLADFLVKDGEKVCLASIRRVATSLPGVVAAKTHMFTETEGKIGFDLTLWITELPSSSGRDLELELRRSLRRSERPRHVTIVAVEAALASEKGYMAK
jgi:long-chain acyl-CoA synthetase